jgi:hypothetical protein
VNLRHSGQVDDREDALDEAALWHHHREPELAVGSSGETVARTSTAAGPGR